MKNNIDTINYNNLDNKKYTENLSEIFHEFKNPLSVIKINIDLLKDEFSELYLRNFEVIDSEFNRIENLIEKYINYNNQNKFNNETVCLNDVIHNVIDEYKKSYNNITFITEEQTNINIKAFEYHLYMIFSNIIKNSIEAMNEIGTINILIYSIDDVANIEIIDEGYGLTLKTLNKLKQGKFTTKPNGSGVGTTIIKNTVNLYNGEFYLLNNINKGAKAVIKIPIEI